MTVSVVLRIPQAALDAGRLAGEVELVATGERATVRDADDLIRFVNRSFGHEPPLRSEGAPAQRDQGGG
jgi:hypothetical protein